MDSKVLSGKSLDSKQSGNDRGITITITLNDKTAYRLCEASGKNFYHEQEKRYMPLDIDGNYNPKNIDGGIMYFVTEYLPALYLYEYCKRMNPETSFVCDGYGDYSYCIISKHVLDRGIV